MANIKRLMDRVWAASEQRSWVLGLLGKPDGAGCYTVAVTNRPGWVYVRVSREGVQSIALARNFGAVAERASTPVRMRLEQGTYVIHQVDPAYYEAATAGDTTNSYGVGYHTHRSDSGLAYEYEAKQFEPGRAFHNVGYQVYVNPFRYFYGGAWAYWAGGSINVEAYLPSTSTKWGWILIGLNPATGNLVAVAGVEVASEAALQLADLGDISFAGYIPLVAIKASEADTDMSDYTRYYDAKAWVGGLANMFNDGEGDPADVVTSASADGTSGFAARRDHVHGIADNAVTLAKLQQIGFGNLLGRYSAGTGAVQTVAIGGGLDYTTTPGLLLRGALSGDVTANAGSGLVEINEGAVGDNELRNSAALSVLGNPTNATAHPTDISTTSGTGYVLRENSGALEFGAVPAGAIDDGSVTNAKLASMSARTIKGRAVGAGTGAPQDLTPAQAAAVVGGQLYMENVGAGNVGAGEDTVATYTVPADQLASFATLWFEAAGTFAANGNTKTIRVTFGATEILEYVTTNNNGVWLLTGRVVCVGSVAQRTHVSVLTNSNTDLQLTNHSEDLSTALDLVVTGEATSDDDIVLRTLTVGWTAPTS